jgi:hypothetical protein
MRGENEGGREIEREREGEKTTTGGESALDNCSLILLTRFTPDFFSLGQNDGGFLSDVGSNDISSIEDLADSLRPVLVKLPSHLDPIPRVPNLQLQRERCKRLST